MQAPLYLARSGNVVDGSLSLAGGSGLYWSSTANGSVLARRLGFDFGTIVPDGSNYRYIGLNIRCVLRESKAISSINIIR